MPDPANPKIREHPFHGRLLGRRPPLADVPYAELAVTTNFTFLTGASHPDEFALRAAELGYRAVAITDTNTLAGVVRAHVAAKQAGIQLIVGTRLTFVDTPDLSVLVYPTNRIAYGRLCALLTTGKRRAPKAECDLSLDELLTNNEGLLAVAILDRQASASLEPSRNIQSRGSVPKRDRKGVGTSVAWHPPVSLNSRNADNDPNIDRKEAGRRSSQSRSASILQASAVAGCPASSGVSNASGTDSLTVAVLIEDALARLRAAFDDDRLSLAIAHHLEPDDAARSAQLHDLATKFNIPLVAVNDAHYHDAGRRDLQDVVTCVRHGCTIHDAGYRLFANGERYLKPPADLVRLFANEPAAITRTIAVADRVAGFNLDALRYEYPDEICPGDLTPQQYLESLAWQGAAERYPEGIPDKIRSDLAHEFALIAELDYAPFFLTVFDIVKFARSKGILCQGRGAAANSAVCFCLGVTSVNPAQIDILFERFVSRERNEPPDIDIDFEHERREEVIQYIYAKYGRDRAGLTAEVISYRSRSAVRDVGKALGLSLDAVDRLAKRIDHWSHTVFENEEDGGEALRTLGFNPDDPTIRNFVRLTRELAGFPRHLGQHVGGFVITRGPLSELVPIENAAMPDRTIIEWDKDDIEAMGMLKVDCLGLGMLTCIRKAMDLVGKHHDRPLTLATIPTEDPVVYDMICRGDTVGVFQIESRAQMTMLPRLKPRCFYDLVIEVAIVRPGPIVGDMVHPYLRRRNGEEVVCYPDEKVKQVLQKTLGVPLFQEQAMALAVVAAGFTPGEAELLRRAITAWKSRDAISKWPARFIEGMVNNGYDRKFAEQCFARLRGFSEYGFPESHSASFALLVYASCWLKCHYPAVFAAALLNSQPMGFYGPAQIVRDAEDHGVRIAPVDVNHSEWDCTLEDAGRTLRLGLRMIKGLRESDAGRVLEAVRRRGWFTSIVALWRNADVPAASLKTLALADAFGSFGLTRQQALWDVQKLDGRPLPLFDGAPENDDTMLEPIELPPVCELREVGRDYERVGLSLKNHPMAFLRESLERQHVRTASEMRDEARTPHRTFGSVAGVVLFRQRPSTAKGVIFMTIEDETGRADLIIRPNIYEKHREAVYHGKVILAHGPIERQGRVVHMLPTRLENIEGRLGDVATNRSRDFR
ncbi:MAG: error-prone DNA polymerase [Phycisphaerales bacterium]|nr:error-prone DNA polymerase [Phycisphaerales bacterium]MCB9854329.1 error-prone DNA polymerase [Phycisphaerales bacterium]MCB9863530.1 error-prone DNA polymerase [Phycisphaerales bacterium]